MQGIHLVRFRSLPLVKYVKRLPILIYSLHIFLDLSFNTSSSYSGCLTDNCNFEALTTINKSMAFKHKLPFPKSLHLRLQYYANLPLIPRSKNKLI
jgi:hypothetical protein